MSGKKHLFVAQRYQGQLAYDAAAPEKSRVDITVEAAGLICQDDWVKPKDLRKIQDLMFAEMLAVERYPAITFRSRSIRPQGRGSGRNLTQIPTTTEGDGEFEVEGDLTIRGIRRLVLLRVTLKPRRTASCQSPAAPRQDDRLRTHNKYTNPAGILRGCHAQSTPTLFDGASLGASRRLYGVATLCRGLCSHQGCGPFGRGCVFVFWGRPTVVSASRSGAGRFYTEDLNHGQTILGVEITNPFSPSKSPASPNRKSAVLSAKSQALSSCGKDGCARDLARRRYG